MALDELKRYLSDMPPTIILGEHTWHTLDPKQVALNYWQRVNALEQQKFSLYMELAEARAVLDAGHGSTEPQLAPGQATPVNLVDHIASLERGIEEYALRIGALLAALKEADLPE